MKTIFTILSLCLAGIAQAQVDLPFNPTSRTFEYAERISLDSVSRDELRERAWKWFASRYKFAREATKKQRKNAETIVTNAWHDIYLDSNLGPLGVQLFYTLEVQAEQNGYRYKISNIRYKTYADAITGRASDQFSAEMLLGKESYLTNGDLKSLNRLYLEATHAYLQQILFGIKLAMNPEGAVAKK